MISEFNSNVSEEDRMHKLLSKAIGNYVYTAINNGFNDYIVIDKSPIENVDEEWSE